MTMLNVIAFPARSADPDFGEEIHAIQNEARLLLKLADQLARCEGHANPATNLAGDMEAVLARLNCAIAVLKQKTTPFLKSQAQLDAEWRDFERQFLS